METSSEHLRELLERTRDGDEDACREIYRLLDLYIRTRIRARLIRCQGMDPGTGLEDVCQQVWIAFLSARKKHSGPIECFGPRLECIIRNKCVDFMRSLQCKSKVVSINDLKQDDLEMLGDDLGMTWRIAVLREAIAQLPPVQQQVIERCSLNGETLGEVASSIGLTPDQVRYARLAALKKLKNVLDH